MQYSTAFVFYLHLSLLQDRTLIYAIKICQSILTVKPTFVVMPYRCRVQVNCWWKADKRRSAGGKLTKKSFCAFVIPYYDLQEISEYCICEL